MCGSEIPALGTVVLTKHISRRTTKITSALLSTLPSSFVSRGDSRRGSSSSFHLRQGILLGLLKGFSRSTFCGRLHVFTARYVGQKTDAGFQNRSTGVTYCLGSQVCHNTSHTLKEGTKSVPILNVWDGGSTENGNTPSSILTEGSGKIRVDGKG